MEAAQQQKASQPTEAEIAAALDLIDLKLIHQIYETYVSIDKDTAIAKSSLASLIYEYLIAKLKITTGNKSEREIVNQIIGKVDDILDSIKPEIAQFIRAAKSMDLKEQTRFIEMKLADSVDTIKIKSEQPQTEKENALNA